MLLLKNVKLTVAIPTYNRSEYLPKALDSVLQQINVNNIGMLEVLISDNNSTDNTVEVVNRYIEKYPDVITYHKNPENIGFDRNIDMLFKKAKGEYVWILSDDDALSNTAISDVVGIVSKYGKLSVIFTNYLECDVRLKERNSRVRVDIKSDVLCESGDEFIANSHFLFGLISSLIIKRDAWNHVDVGRYFDSSWVFIGALFEILSKNGFSYVFSKKLVLLRMGNSYGKDNEKNFFLFFGLLRIVNGMRMLNYEKATIDYLVDNIFYGAFNTLLVTIRDGIKIKTRFMIIVGMIKSFCHRVKMWFLYLPMLFVPSLVYKLLYKSYCLFKKD